MPAILFGSISTVADTSELQREAFNAAFAQHGLDWRWDRDDYRAMLDSSGGAQRVADYAASRGETVDAAAVHRTKSEIYRDRLAAGGVQARPGVADTIRGAKRDGLEVALVTTTSEENVDALLAALADEVDRSAFDLIVDTTDVEQPKPAPDAYAFALERLGEPADACVAIEDNVGGVQAAAAAGVRVLAFPNANTDGHDFAGAEQTVSRVDLAELKRLVQRG